MSRETVEKDLTAQYGPPEDYAAPGLDWLFESESNAPYCMDHPEYRVKNGKRTVTARPYAQGINTEQIETLVQVARRKNLLFFLERASNYNGGTILIILTEMNIHPLD